MMRATVWTALGFTLVASACAGSASPSQNVSPGDTDLPLEIRWVRSSAEHRAMFLQVYRDASDVIREQVGSQSGPWGVILDADETVFDNSEYQVRLASTGQTFSSETWYAWVREERATVLPGAAGFVELVKELGGHVVIVTNRDEVVCEPTRRNFVRSEIVVDQVLCRQDGEQGKEGRFEAVRQGVAPSQLPALEVLVFVGDNIHDFPGMSQEVRIGSEDALGPFGRRFFVLPNPMYGSWD